MNQLDHQDRRRYWKIDQIKCSASVFAAAAESGFRERFGHLAGDKAQGAFAAMGSIFDMTADDLDGLKARLDRARFDRAESRIARRRVRAAERLIRETDATLPEIGRRVGFTVPRTFRRTFRRILGMTPHEMRVSCLEPPPEEAGPPAGTEDGDLSPAARSAAWRRRITLCFAGQRQGTRSAGRPGPTSGKRAWRWRRSSSLTPPCR